MYGPYVNRGWRAPMGATIPPGRKITYRQNFMTPDGTTDSRSVTFDQNGWKASSYTDRRADGSIRTDVIDRDRPETWDKWGHGSRRHHWGHRAPHRRWGGWNEMFSDYGLRLRGRDLGLAPYYGRPMPPPAYAEPYYSGGYADPYYGGAYSAPPPLPASYDGPFGPDYSYKENIDYPGYSRHVRYRGGPTNFERGIGAVVMTARAVPEVVGAFQYMGNTFGQY